MCAYRGICRGQRFPNASPPPPHTHTHPVRCTWPAGYLSNADIAVAVTGLCLQFSTLVWLVAAAIGEATTTRIANALGEVGGPLGGEGLEVVWGALPCQCKYVCIALSS